MSPRPRRFPDARCDIAKAGVGDILPQARAIGERGVRPGWWGHVWARMGGLLKH